MSIMVGMQPLVSMCDQILTSTTLSNARADASVVLASLYFSNNDARKAMHHIDNAIIFRPKHALQLSLRSGLEAAFGIFGKSLEDAKKSLALMKPTDPYYSITCFERRGEIGKCYVQLGRMEEAIVELEEYVKMAFEDEVIAPGLDDLMKGRALVAQYMLVPAIGKSATYPNAKRHAIKLFKLAEEREQLLSREAHAQVGWDQKLGAQMWIAHNSLGGSYRECHHCRKAQPKLQICTGCNAANYCNSVCQKAAWKAGHKQECAMKDAERKKEKSKGKKKKTTPIVALDADLDPNVLYAKAVVLAEKATAESGQAEAFAREACWIFLVYAAIHACINQYLATKPPNRYVCIGNLPDLLDALETCQIFSMHTAYVLTRMCGSRVLFGTSPAATKPAYACNLAAFLSSLFFTPVHRLMTSQH
jgi:tetratricopeptide (TPR) repeat protein